ncbi:type I phosphodiesterase/nucleotide pyrophosphatase, partial [mine drainage metagenome]
RALGIGPSEGPPVVPPLSDGLDPFDGRPPTGTILLLLVDGFGWFPFSAWSRRSRAGPARAWGDRARPITTVFPSTTVSALTSLSTGTTPAQHGIVGPNLYLPRLDAVVDVLRMARVESAGREELVDAAWRPSDVSGAASLFRRGLVGTTVTRHAFARTGFNRILYDGAEFVGYATASDLAHVLAD